MLTGNNWHPVADIFPMMSDREYRDLVADISEHGLREPIWLHRDGRIIDGRNRWLACCELGVTPEVRTYEGDDAGLVAFVVSLNLHRRHLDESQRAMVAARIANLQRGRPTENPSIEGIGASAAAELLNVGRASVERARAVLASPVPELAEAVESRKVAVSTAATIATAPPEEQREVVAVDDEKEIIRRAKEIQQRRKEERLREKAAKVAEIQQRRPEPLANLGPFPVLPDFAAMLDLRHDGWHQRAGRDRAVMLTSGSVIYVDEKVRSEAYDDVALEVWSVYPKSGQPPYRTTAGAKPGWAREPKDCDWLAYAFVPTHTCYLFPFLGVRAALEKHKAVWVGSASERLNGFRWIVAHNTRYDTISLAVPIWILHGAIADAMTVNWKDQA